MDNLKTLKERLAEYEVLVAKSHLFVISREPIVTGLSLSERKAQLFSNSVPSGINERTSVFVSEITVCSDKEESAITIDTIIINNDNAENRSQEETGFINNGLGTMIEENKADSNVESNLEPSTVLDEPKISLSEEEVVDINSEIDKNIIAKVDEIEKKQPESDSNNNEASAPKIISKSTLWYQTETKRNKKKVRWTNWQKKVQQKNEKK